MSNVPDWPFDHPPNPACITTRLVLEEGYPILLVTHDADDGAGSEGENPEELDQLVDEADEEDAEEGDEDDYIEAQVVDDEEEDMVPKDDDEEEVTPKRKRGRPRKNK